MKKLETNSQLAEEIDKLLSQYGEITGGITINGYVFFCRHDGADEKYVRIMGWRLITGTVFEARRYYNRTEFWVSEELTPYVEQRILFYMPVARKWLKVEEELNPHDHD